MAQSKTLLAVKKKHFDLTKSFHTNFEKVTLLQKQAIEEILPALSSELDLQEEGRSRARAFLDDLATIFRFYRRSRYNADAALSLLTSTLLWRLRTDLDLLSLTSLHPLYVSPPSPENPPLFWLNSQFKDKFSRPCGLISLRSLERTQERTLDEIKEYIVASMEITRRYLANQFSKFLNQRNESGLDFNDMDLNQDEEEDDEKWIESSAPIQMTIAFDLAGSGMANLELELLPFLLDLLKNHFPGMVGAVYILNYGWVHSGMWAVAKRVLPEQALAKIFFPNNQELNQHFHPENLPVELGGENQIEIDSESADISKKFGKRRRFFNGHAHSNNQTPSDSPTIEKKSLSRNPSYENIYDVFYSAAGTPWASRPASPRGSGRSTPRRSNDSPSSSTFPLPSPSHQLQMTPSADRKLRNLQMTRGSGDLSLTAEMNDRNKFSEFSPSHSPRRSRANSAAGGGISQPPTFSSSNNRHVRFTGSNSGVDLTTSSPPPSIPGTPSRRIGNVRDFRFHLPQSTHEDDILNMEESESESDAESDQSGKVGEKRVSPVDESKGQLKVNEGTPNPPGLFARLRRASRNSFGAMTGVGSSSDPLNENGKRDSSIQDEEKSYRTKLRNQQALQSTSTSSTPEIQVQDQDQGEDPTSSSSASISTIRDANVVSTDLPSPELQVPLMDEEPLAGNQVSSPTVHFFSQRSKKYNAPGIVSPYNAGNPFWGYPAIVPGANRNSNLNPNSIPGGETNSLGLSTGNSSSSNFNHHHHQSLSSTTPRQLHSRRRKRDLIRTLSYLFVLRFLAFHRHLRWKLILIWKEIFKTLKIGGNTDGLDGVSNNHLEMDHRWKALEEKHRLNRMKSKSMRKGGNFDLHSRESLNQSSQNKGLKFLTFWKTWLTLFMICLMLKPKIQKTFPLTLIAFIQSRGNGKDFKEDSLSKLVDSLKGGRTRTSLTGLHVRERLLGI